jgi:hypothetical protein
MMRLDWASSCRTGNVKSPLTCVMQTRILRKYSWFEGTKLASPLTVCHRQGPAIFCTTVAAGQCATKCTTDSVEDRRRLTKTDTVSNSNNSGRRAQEVSFVQPNKTLDIDFLERLLWKLTVSIQHWNWNDTRCIRRIY